MEGYHPKAKERHTIAWHFYRAQSRSEVWAAARAGEETVARVLRLRQQQIEVTNFDFDTIYDGILFVERCY